MVKTEAQTLLEALEEAKNQLGTEKIIYTKEEIKGKLFKAGKFIVSAISYEELEKEIKEYLKELVKPFAEEINFESSIREDVINITMYTNNNKILIGRNGNTLKALETMVKNKIKKEWNVYVRVVLDVSNYKEKRINTLERIAIKVAKEVRNTKVDAELENMNSFERRVIHNKLANFKNVATESVGEEPNRHIIIKYTNND